MQRGLEFRGALLLPRSWDVAPTVHSCSHLTEGARTSLSEV